jgi:hypothetical protein
LHELRRLQEEKERRQAEANRRVDVFGKLGFEPNCRVQHAAAEAGEEIPPRCGQCPQERFLDLPWENMDIFYGGAGGGGKSHSLLMFAIQASVRFPGLQTFWFRRSFPELNQSVIRMLARYRYAEVFGTHWHGGKHELHFPGGSIITFGHAKNVQEASALLSAEINLLLLDERTTMSPDVVDLLYTRVRSGVPGVPCLGIRSASNPGNIGHGNVKRRYVVPTDYGEKELVDGAGRRVIFIPAKVSDNPFIGDYGATLAGIEDPELRRMIADGDWSVMPDQAFPDWRLERIRVPRFPVPQSWMRYGGLDYGWAAPSVFLAAAKDNDGRMWGYRELSMVQTPEKLQAKRILGVCAEDGQVPRPVAADPAMWGKHGEALPPATQIALEGLALRKADNDRITGKARVHSYLSEGPACVYHRSLGWALCPMLHVFDGCRDLLNTVGELPRDPNRIEDVNTDAPDHWYDALRYLLMAVGTAPQQVFDDEPADSDKTLTDIGGYGWKASDLHRHGIRELTQQEDGTWAQV